MRKLNGKHDHDILPTGASSSVRHDKSQRNCCRLPSSVSLHICLHLALHFLLSAHNNPSEVVGNLLHLGFFESMGKGYTALHHLYQMAKNELRRR
jgi:hypothetical protein